MPSLGDIIRAAGEAVIAAPADQVDATLLAQLQRFVPTPYRIETGIVADSEGRRTEPLTALICVGRRVFVRPPLNKLKSAAALAV